MGTNYSSVNDPMSGPDVATGAADASSRSGETAKSAVRDAAQGAREQARDVKDQVVQQGRDTLDQVKQKATSTLADSKMQLADKVGTVAHVFRRTTEELRSENQPTLARYAESAAAGVERLSTYLRDRNAQELLNDIERLARRQPGLFLGGAFAVGLAAARFLRSSSPTPSGDAQYSGTSDSYRSGYGQSAYGQGAYGQSSYDQSGDTPQLTPTTSPSTPANYGAPLGTEAPDAGR